jgi:hypothetical protein
VAIIELLIEKINVLIGKYIHNLIIDSKIKISIRVEIVKVLEELLDENNVLLIKISKGNSTGDLLISPLSSNRINILSSDNKIVNSLLIKELHELLISLQQLYSLIIRSL